MVLELPPDLYLELLLRTPIRDLIRFRCSGRRSNALINSPVFKKLHLDFNTPRNKVLICNSPIDNNGRKQIALVRYNRPPISVLTIDKNLVEIPDEFNNMVLAGSIDGIVCLANVREMAVGLWNPSVNHWKAIKLSETKSWHRMSVGFGYDSKKNDYKVICIVPVTHCRETNWSRIEIYSVEMNSWEKVVESRIVPFTAQMLRQCNFIVKGVPYWEGMDKRVGGFRLLARVNPCSGLYETIVYPKLVKPYDTPVNFKDDVAVLIRSQGVQYMDQTVDLFLLDENMKTWTLIYRIAPRMGGRALIPQCLGTGHIVVKEFGLFFWDPHTGFVPGNEAIEALNPTWQEAYTHVESLLCVKGMKNIWTEQTEFPPALYLESLFRTSIRDLIRYKCTSKSSYALINSPVFKKLHLDFNTPRNKVLICNSSFDKNGRKRIALVRYNRPPICVLTIDRNLIDSPNEFLRSTQPTDPNKIKFDLFSKNMVLAGSIDGIICLANVRELAGRFVGLWNPSINHWKAIKLSENKSWKYMSVGFGYDSEKNDYKVICFVPVTHCQEANWARIEIYSVESDSWEEVVDSRIVPFTAQRLRQCNFIVKGVPYWEGMDKRVGGFRLLARVNPCSGLYETIEYPKLVKPYDTFPVNFKDDVAVLILSQGVKYMDQMVDLFLLDENMKTWTLIYRIAPRVGGRVLIPQCLGTGHIVIQSVRFAEFTLFFWDPQTGTCVPGNKAIEAFDPTWNQAYNHVESLICFKGMESIWMEQNYPRTNPLIKDWSEYLSKDLGSVLHL